MILTHTTLGIACGPIHEPISDRQISGWDSHGGSIRHLRRSVLSALGLRALRGQASSLKCGDYVPEVFAYYNHPGKTGDREHVGYVHNTVLILFNIKVH